MLPEASIYGASFSDHAEEDCFRDLLSTQHSSSPELQAGKLYAAPPHFDLFGSTTTIASRGALDATTRTRVKKSDFTPGAALASSNECIPLEDCTSTLSTLIKLPVTPCSSCGTLPTVTSRPYILLKGCDHLLCSVCINTLVNSVCNEPPRQPDCFTCSARVVDFGGVTFDFAEVSAGLGDLRGTAQWRTPTRERTWPTGTFSSGSTFSSRNSEWSKVYGSAWSTPESARSYCTTDLRYARPTIRRPP